MSRKQRVMLTLEVRTPLPAGWTQKQFVDNVKALLADQMLAGFTPETQVKLVGREVTYL